MTKKQLRGKLTKLDEKGTKWQAVVHTGFNPETKKYDKRRKTFYGNTRQAEAFLRDFIAELETEAENPYSRQPYGEWLDYWLDTYGEIMYKWEKNTFDRARRIVEVNIKPYLKDIPLCELEPEHFIQLYTYLGKHGKVSKKKDANGNLINKRSALSSRTIRYVHVIINQSLNEAVKLRKIPVNPADGLTPKKEKNKPKGKWVVLDTDQLSSFLHDISYHRDYAIIFVAAYTGARESELIGLTKDKISWDKKELRIEQALHLDDKSEDGFEHRQRTKNDTSERIIDVSDRVVNVLKDYLESQKEKGIESDLVFTEPDGSFINRNNLCHRFSNLVKKHGHPGMTFHHLRHTHATILLSNGEYINEVAERLGHADSKITFSLYGHVLPQRKRVLSARFDELVTPVRKETPPILHSVS